MHRFNGHDIEITQGDTLLFRIVLDGRDLPEGSVGYFTVKKNPKRDEALIEKKMNASDGELIVQLDSADTNLPARTYYWDVRLLIPRDDGGYEVETPMEYAAFTVLEAVGEAGEYDDGMDADVPVISQLIKEAREAIDGIDQKVKEEVDGELEWLDNKITLGLDAVATHNRHLLFGFSPDEMKLCISGSNDNASTIRLLAKNVYQPKQGRKTLRDPSAVWYKGCLYIVYTIIDWASGSSNIGFCRTRDLVHFEELPQLPTNNSVYPNIPRCYAPAFCVIDGHLYIASAAVGEGKTFTNKFGETFDESAAAGWSVITRGNMMVHEYFPESHTLEFVGLLSGISGIDVHVCKVGSHYYAAGRNFKLYRSDELLGPYELIWDGTEYSASGSEIWREGAFLLEKPDGKWRFFAHKPDKPYEYYDSLTTDLEDGFESEIQACAGDTGYSMHMTMLDTVTMEEAVSEGRAYALTNLLHNADFTQMVAQAGVGAVHGGGSVTFAGDRWELVSGSVTAVANAAGNGYGSVTLNGTIRQKVENPPDEWTIGVVARSGKAEAFYDNGWFTITSDGGVLHSAYLYEGYYRNAPRPVARGYAAELLECQRFYVRLNGSGGISYHGYAFGTDSARMMIPLPVAMRKSNPTYKVEWTFNMTLYPGGISPTGISSMSVVGSFCSMVLTASGLTADANLMAKGNATIELNCDLGDEE